MEISVFLYMLIHGRRLCIFAPGIYFHLKKSSHSDIYTKNHLSLFFLLPSFSTQVIGF